MLALAAVVVLGGCGRTGAPAAHPATRTPNQRNVNATHGPLRDPLVMTTSPPQQRLQVTPKAPAAPAPTTLPADVLAQLAPGSRRLVEDCTSGALSMYACTEAAMAKLGQLRATVPARYRDPASAMTSADMAMLGTLANQASRRLSPAEVNTLKKEVLPM